MAFARFSPKSVDKNISSTLTRMNFNSLINDYNNGLLALGENAKYSAVNVEVFNVKKYNTVSCTIKVLNRTINRSYTSRYEDTTVRNIYEKLDIPENTTSLMNSIISNNGNVDVSITSGTSNFRSPATVWFEFTTAVRNGMTDKDLFVDGDKIDKPIRIYRTDGNVGMYVTLQSKAAGAASSTIIFEKASNTNYVEIPAGTIKDLNATHTAYVNAGAVLESYGDIKFNYGPGNAYAVAQLNNLSLSLPTLSNLSTVGNLWEKSIDVNWRSENQEGYEYETYYNNELKTKGTGGVQTGFTIPAKTFPGTFPASVRVRAYRTYNGVKYYSSWAEQSITLKDIEATVSSLIIEGDKWEKSIKVSWRSTDQEQFKLEVFKANDLVKTYTGTTATAYTIQAETLTQGDYTFKVTVAYANRFVNATERTINLKDVQATVGNLALSGSNIDLDLSLSWDSADQHKYEVEIYKDTTQVKAYSGTLDKNVAIPHNSLTTGLHKFKVRVAYKDRWTQWIEINVTLVEATPSIGVLEPDGVIVDKDYPTRIWWTSSNQTKWKITLDGSTFYEGTWQTEHTIPGGMLQTGKHTLNLVVTYITVAGVEKTAFKNAEFIVQGKPPIPTFTNGNSFTTSRPIFSWDTQDQQGYLLEILKDNNLVWSTEWQNGLVTRQKVLTYLPNGTYTARLKIINQFSIESDYGKTTFTVNASEASTITLDAIKHQNTVQLSWDNIGYKFEKFYIIRNGEVIAKTTDTIYTDYTAFGECIYVVRGVNASDIYKDSNLVSITFMVDYSCIATVEDLSDMLNVSISKEQFAFKGSLEITQSIMHMTGRALPVTIFSEHETNTYNITFNQKQLGKFAQMYRRRQVFCYRDKREKLYLTISNPNYDIDPTGYSFKVSATQTYFDEVIEYD